MISGNMLYLCKFICAVYFVCVCACECVCLYVCMRVRVSVCVYVSACMCVCIAIVYKYTIAIMGPHVLNCSHMPDQLGVKSQKCN